MCEVDVQAQTENWEWAKGSGLPGFPGAFLFGARLLGRGCGFAQDLYTPVSAGCCTSREFSCFSNAASAANKAQQAPQASYFGYHLQRAKLGHILIRHPRRRRAEWRAIICVTAVQHTTARSASPCHAACRSMHCICPARTDGTSADSQLAQPVPCSANPATCVLHFCVRACVHACARTCARLCVHA